MSSKLRPCSGRGSRSTGWSPGDLESLLSVKRACVIALTSSLAPDRTSRCWGDDRVVARIFVRVLFELWRNGCCGCLGLRVNARCLLMIPSYPVSPQFALSYLKVRARKGKVWSPSFLLGQRSQNRECAKREKAQQSSSDDTIKVWCESCSFLVMSAFRGSGVQI